MSNIALFLATGIVVREKGINKNNESYQLLPTNGQKYYLTYEGKVLEFKIKLQNNQEKKYIYIGYENLLTRDKKENDFTSFGGFCDEARYIDYKNYVISLAELNDDNFWFDKNFELAKIGDSIKIERIDFSNPSLYYSQKTYSFNISDTNIDFTKPQQYPSNTTIDSSGSQNLLSTDSGKFYSKNIPAINSIPNEYKEEYTRLLTFICFRIYYIAKEILIVFTMKDNNNADENLSQIKQAIKKKYSQNDSSPYNTLSEIDKVIGELLKSWGYITDIEPDFMFQNKSIDFVRNYENSISSFYFTLKGAKESVYFPYDSHGNPKNFQGYILTNDGIVDQNGNVGFASQAEKDKKDSERRIAYLFKYLTTEALGVFSYDQRMAWLKNIVGQLKIEQQNANAITQNNLIKLLNTFANIDEADSLLNYILEDNGLQTNFEVLYNKLDDGRLERYPVISWFVEEATNRKYYIYTMYSIWKVSNYNPYHIPQGITANEDNLNPNSFFLNEGKKYYPKFNNQGEVLSGSNPVLEFSVQKQQGGSNPYFQVLSTSISFKPVEKLNKEIIIVDIVNTTNANVYTPYGSMVSSYGDNNKYGEYHLYQPISLLGYEADLDLSIPNLTPIPAFLFYYAVDYDELKDFDVAISFAVQVTFDIALFYFTGGASALKHLSYIKYITEINNVRKGLVAADKAVLFWKGIDSASQVVSVTSGTLTAFFDYQANTSNNPNLVNMNRKLSYFFLVLALGSGGGSAYSRNRTVKAADDVLDEIIYLNEQNIPHNLSPEVENIINLVGNKLVLRTTEIIDKLSTNYPQLSNTLLSIKNSGNVRLSFELGGILINRNAQTLKKLNSNIAFFNQFNDLSKVKDLKNISSFYDDFYLISQLQNAQKGRAVFSEFIGGVQASGYLHTIDDVYEVMNYGIQKNLNIDDVNGLIIKSFRTQKQVNNISELKNWIDNYKNFLNSGIPYPFGTNMNNFLLFKSEIKTLFTKYGLGNEITIGGSSLTKTIPPDLDLVLYFKPSKYDDLIKHYENVLNEILSNPKLNTKYKDQIKIIEEGLISSKNNGKIDVRCMVNIRTVNGQPKLDFFLSDLKSGNFINQLNISNDLKNGLDFNIYRSLPGNRAISLPPEFKISLN